MTQFGQNQNWLQGLQNLFGQQQGQQGRGADTGYWTGSGLSTTMSPLAWRTNLPGQGELAHRTVGESPFGGGGAPTYGHVLAGALAQDYQNAERARQQELDMYRGLFTNLMGSFQGAGQMVQDARQAGQQNMGLMQQQADQMRRAAAGGDRAYQAAVAQMQSGLREARGRMDQGIGTLQKARSEYDTTFRGDTAGQVLGIQQQYKNQLDQIARRDDLTQEQKDMMTGELKQGMHQQSSALAAQADAKVRDTLLSIDQSISQMQSAAGAQLGQFGIGIGQAMGQLGMQSAAMKQQAEEQIGQFYNSMAQFNSGLVQSAQATALQYMLSGNQLAANLVNAMPLGPMSVFETLTRMVSAGDFRRGQRVAPEMGALFGRVG